MFVEPSRVFTRLVVVIFNTMSLFIVPKVQL